MIFASLPLSLCQVLDGEDSKKIDRTDEYRGGASPMNKGTKDNSLGKE